MSTRSRPRDLYEVLEVERDANQAELKKAYYRLAQKYHPDKCPGDKDAEERFKEAASAYQVLSDKEQREIYDRRGRNSPGGSAASDPGFGPGFANVEDVFSAFGDLFNDFFGASPRVKRGDDLHVDLELAFAEAVWGTSKDVKIRRDVSCDACSGTGAATGSKPAPCNTCSGKGKITRSQGFFVVQSTCPTCRGASKLIEEPCVTCQGRGTSAATTTLSVAVPPGVDEGQVLRLMEKGETAPGGLSGHLYITLRTRKDPRFQRDGDDVLTEVPISFVDAALGGEVEIPTLDDRVTGTATIELKAGTQPGDVVVRRGQGIPRLSHDGSRGNQIVRWKVEIPKKLSGRQRDLLRELSSDLEGTRERGKARRSSS